MIGRQTRFYAHPDDYGELASGLRSLGAVTIARQHAPTGEPVITDITDPRSSINVFVTLPEFLGVLRARYSDHLNWPYSVLDDLLVELYAWRPQAGMLRPGRIYFVPWELSGEEPRLGFRDKPPEFTAFAERVRRWLRRWGQRREDLLLAPSLAVRFDRGEIRRNGIQGDLELLSS